MEIAKRSDGERYWQPARGVVACKGRWQPARGGFSSWHTLHPYPKNELSQERKMIIHSPQVSDWINSWTYRCCISSRLGWIRWQRSLCYQPNSTKCIWTECAICSCWKGKEKTKLKTMFVEYIRLKQKVWEFHNSKQKDVRFYWIEYKHFMHMNIIFKQHPIRML